MKRWGDPQGELLRGPTACTFPLDLCSFTIDKITQDFFRDIAEKLGQILAFSNFDFTKFLTF